MNAALIKLTEERIDSNDALSTFVEKARAITIPLFPETVQFTDSALKFGAAVVGVNTSLDQYGNNRDIYKNESGSYCLHLTKLNEIAQQSGLQITDSRVLERKTDEHGRVTYIEHQVKWKLRSIDGSVKEGVATGKYDYFRDYESMRDKDGKVREKQVNGRRKHAEALAESNALTRAYNKAIAKLPQGFTLDELKKPFLIPYVIEDKDELLKQLPAEDQALIRKELVRKRLGIADSIYQAPQNGSNYQPKENEVETEVLEAETIQPEPKGLSLEEKAKIDAEGFRDVNQKERTLKILALCTKTNCVNKSGAPITITQVEQKTIDKQIEFLTALIIKSQEESEDLPL